MRRLQISVTMNCTVLKKPFVSFSASGCRGFFAPVEIEIVPSFVKVKFKAFLEFGILAHGYLGLSYAYCAHKKLVA
ncbi:hypothetical protein NTGM5_120115 [Candidatus Nitrotoga sp. M5]|nr:hypothetical protein NTGM5_120115 [Candidatus Nitrotoga sp. M5]